MQTFILVVLALGVLLFASIAFTVRNSKSSIPEVAANEAFGGTPVVHAIMRGMRVAYTDRNKVWKVGTVQDFTRGGRVRLHVGHPNHADFTRWPSELYPLSS